MDSYEQPSVYVRFGQAMEARGSQSSDATGVLWTAE